MSEKRERLRLQATELESKQWWHIATVAVGQSVIDAGP
jgi:hypothetical protein